MLNIRRAEISDIAALAPLFVQYLEFYNKPGMLKIITEFLKERFKRDESVIFVAVKENGIVGFTQLYPTFSSITLGKIWILNDLFVSPATRRESVGRQLMQKAVEFAQTTGAVRMTLKTAEDNVPAQQLYESLGWKRDVRFWTYNLKIEPAL